MKYALSLALLLLFSTPLQAQSLTAESKADIALSRALINDKRNTAVHHRGNPGFLAAVPPVPERDG
jgi:hypothetical protein